jgi:hypothetical protein
MPPTTISATRLMELLAPTLGWEKSSEVVSVALARRGMSHGELSIDDALVVLDHLAQSPGMVGIAARYAATRLGALRPAAPAADNGPPSSVTSQRASSPEHPSSSRTRAITVDLRDIIELFAGAMSPEQSEATVLGAARQLRLPKDRLDKVQALSLVDHLAAEPGVVGLCARFAKARLILRFAA